MVKKFVVIKTQFEALHHWPECPFEEVAFLKNPHRHIFYVVIKWQTTEDRQLEFFMQKKKAEELIERVFGGGKFLGRSSCEYIAEFLLSELRADFVSVYEDDENGAEVYVNENSNS